MRETLIAVFLALLQLPLARAQQSSSSNPNTTEGLCRQTLLPLAIQQHVRQNFSSWRIAEARGLADSARERWKAEKPLGCPGIAAGHFKGTSSSFAILLIPKAPGENGYKLLAFTRKNQGAYEPTILDQSNDAKRSNLFIHAVNMSRFFNEESKKKFRAFEPEGILLADAGQGEYETDLYFWADGKYQHEPVDY